MRLLFDGGGGETGRITRAVVLNIASASESPGECFKHIHTWVQRLRFNCCGKNKVRFNCCVKGS